MTIKSRVKSVKVLDGVYPLEVAKVEKQVKDYGEVLIISFRVISGEAEGRVVKGMATYHDPLTSRCKLYNWAKAILNRRLGDEEIVDWDGTVGNKCLGEIRPRETGSGTFERVVRLIATKIQ